MNYCLSGGAIGSDFEFGKLASEVGHRVIHFSFQSHKILVPIETIHILNKEELEIVDPYLDKANETLGRFVPRNKPWIMNLLRRNYYQIVESERVYAVGKWINLDEKLIDGGTAWACQMYIDKDGKELYFFDQESNQWWFYNGMWQESNEIPKPFGIYAGIGIRKLNEIGKEEIRKLYSR